MVTIAVMIKLNRYGKEEKESIKGQDEEKIEGRYTGIFSSQSAKVLQLQADIQQFEYPESSGA